MAIRPPQQTRSRASLERVVDASLQLLEEQGVEGFTVADASERAGVSVGAIYARFGSKESLLHAAHRRTVAGLSKTFPRMAAAGDRPAAGPHAVITAAVCEMAGIMHEHERLLRPFMHLGALDAEIARVGSESSIELAHEFARIALVHRDAIVHAEPELAVDVSFRMAYSTFARRVMHGSLFESDRDLAWPELAREVGMACAVYLFGSDPAA